EFFPCLEFRRVLFRSTFGVGDVAVDGYLRLELRDEAAHLVAFAGLERDLLACGTRHLQLTGRRAGPDELTGGVVVLERREGHRLLELAAGGADEDAAPRVVVCDVLLA